MTTDTSSEVRPPGEQPNKYRTNVRPAPYRIPAAPPIAWAPDNSPRRAWLSRILLLGLLFMQLILTLRLRNSIYSAELQVLPDHRSGDFFTGSSLYPSIAAPLESAIGLQGLRFLSAIFMVCATGLLYSWSTRLFNERVGLSAAGSFSVLASTLVLGALATEDALAMMLLALATWLVVLSRSGPLWPAIAAAPVALLAVSVKYTVVFYLPSVVLLALLVSLRHTNTGQAAIRTLPLGLAFLAGLGYYFAATSGLNTPATPALSDLFTGWIHWIGLYLIFGVLGLVFYARRARMGEVPTGASADPSPAWRITLSLTFLLPALLAPLLLLGDPVFGTVWRPQLAYSALLAASMVGVGLVRMIGAHFRFPQLGIMAAVALLSLGMAQSEYEYSLWPNYQNIATVLDTEVTTSGHYLASNPETFSFYMKEYRPSQWTATTGNPKNGAADFTAALRKQAYDLIVVEAPTRSATDRQLLASLEAGVGHYRMLTAVPFRIGWTEGGHQIWVKDKLPPTVP